MSTWKATLILGVLCLGAWAMLSGVMQAQTEPVPAQAQMPTEAQTVAVERAVAEQQALAIVGQAVQGFLLYAPTTEAQRKLTIESYNAVKAAVDRLAALEKPTPDTAAIDAKRP